MLRFAVLCGLTAFIWFVLNDGPGVTKSTPLPEKSAIFVPVKLIATVPENIIAPQDMIFAQAQSQPTAQTRTAPKPRAPTRIRVYSAGPMARHCVDWYAEERRPSGTVVVPHMRCRWVRR
jgi:hypothetical protein